MNKQKEVAAAVSLALTLSGTALPPVSLHRQGLAPWQLINYYAGDELNWWEQSVISAGVAVACTFIGAGVGTITGPGGIVVGFVCDEGIGL
jgi:hypothetical protein